MTIHCGSIDASLFAHNIVPKLNLIVTQAKKKEVSKKLPVLMLQLPLKVHNNISVTFSTWQVE